MVSEWQAVVTEVVGNVYSYFPRSFFLTAFATRGFWINSDGNVVDNGMKLVSLLGWRNCWTPDPKFALSKASLSQRIAANEGSPSLNQRRHEERSVGFFVFIFTCFHLLI